MPEFHVLSQSAFYGFENGRLGVPLYDPAGVSDPEAFRFGEMLGSKITASAEETARAGNILSQFAARSNDAHLTMRDIF